MAKRTASAKKQARAGVRRTARNRGVRSEVKTMVVKALRSYGENAGADNDRTALTVEAISALDRAAAKGILHRNNAARRKARLMRQLVKLGVPVATPAKAKAPAAAAKGKKGAAAPAPAPAKSDKKGKK